MQTSDRQSNIERRNNPIIFSFFSGSGFLDLGFENEGYEIAFVNEISSSFLRAYKHSRTKLGFPVPRYGYFNADINDFLNGRKDELSGYVNDAQNKNRLVGFIGGPPCPDFSVAGKNKGSEGQNGKLSLAYVKLIADILPDFFLFENVKGMWSTAKHREFYNGLKAILNNAGFSTSEHMCNALDFGVPQDRERIFLFGIKYNLLMDEAVHDSEIVDFPWKAFIKHEANQIKRLPWCKSSTFGEDCKVELNEVMLPLTVGYWFEKNNVSEHANSKAHFVPRAGKAKMEMVLEGDVSKKSHKRLHRFRYSPTAAYGNNEVHLHPTQVRRISAAEAMAVQSMPKEFELPPDMTLTDMFKTIGNGVPFLLSCGIAKTIKHYLEERVCEN